MSNLTQQDHYGPEAYKIILSLSVCLLVCLSPNHADLDRLFDFDRLFEFDIQGQVH